MPNDDIEILGYSKTIVDIPCLEWFSICLNSILYLYCDYFLRYKLRCSKYTFATFIVLSIQLCNFVKNCMCCKISLNPTKRYQMKSLEADVINREMIRKEMQNGFSNSSTELADATFLA